MPAAPAPSQVDDENAIPDEDEESVESAPASVAASPAEVRNSPEYRALRSKLRNEARARGRIEQQLASEREARAVAEADRAAEQEDEIRRILGDAGVEAWNRISDLSTSDPVAAARAMADFGRTLAQSQPDLAPVPQAEPPPVNGGTTVAPTNGTAPPPPSMGVGAGVPLGVQGSDNSWSAIRADAEKRFAELVEKNRNPVTRNRMTMRDRADGIITYVAGAVAGAMEERAARPR
jgi:hypothetical protein